MNSNLFVRAGSHLASTTPRLRNRVKPVGFFSRLLSAWLAALMIVGQPALIWRVMAEELPGVNPKFVVIATDRIDYAPGSLATITGSGFEAGETVLVQVLHADGKPATGEDHEPWVTTADANGAFATTWHVCEDDCLDSMLEVTAVGITSAAVARTWFSDGLTSPGVWSEDADAGELLNTAQLVLGSGSLTRINGTVSTQNDTDMYRIEASSSLLSATTEGTGGSLIDPQLFLFDASGALIAFNDDIVQGVNRQSRLSNIPVTLGATYYIAVNSWSRQPNGTPPSSWSGSGCCPGTYGIALSGARLLNAATTCRDALVYANDFEAGAGTGPEWSPNGTDPTPIGRRYLGRFGNQTARLTLASLSPHTEVEVSFDVYVIQSWDGNGNYCCGPDIWSFGVTGEAPKIRTTFSNTGGVGSTQSYPENYPNTNPAQTGALEVNSLGWGYDSVYRMTFRFPHTSNTLSLDFGGANLQEISDESWGLDNVTVKVCELMNRPPTANADSYTFSEDGIGNIPAGMGLLANDTDADGNALTVTAYTGPTHGTLTTFNDGSFNYTPFPNYNGPDSFTYTISDGNGGSASATVNITVTPVNDNPSAAADAVTGAEDSGTTFINVLANDTIAPDVGETLRVTAVSSAAHGTTAFTAAGVSYTPNADFNGVDSFIYTISDGNGGSASATVAVTITPVNDVPSALPQSLTTAEDTAKSFLLAASDIDGDALSFTITATPTHGVLSTTHGLTYTPAANYNGPDSFTFKVNDGTVDSAEATVTISVTAVNDGPQLASPGNKLVNEMELLAFTLSASDVDTGDSLAFSISNGAQPGMTLDATSGAFAWTPTEAQGPGSYTVTFRVTDAAGLFDEKTITIEVAEVNVVPTISDVPSEATIPEMVPFTFNASGNDPDAPVQALTFALIGAPAGATIDAASGEFNWTPSEADGPGDYAFKVRISDGVATADAPVTLHVTEVNAAPRFGKFAAYLVDEGTEVTDELAATDADQPANVLTYSMVSGAPAGLTLNAATGAFAWTPTEAQGPGSYAVTFRVTDAGGLFDERTLTITVNEVNTAPIANAQSVSTAEDTPLAIVLTGSDVDLPANALTYSVADGPSHGGLSGTAPKLTYTPDADYFGADSFTYTISDGNGGSAMAVISITVNNVNDAPVLALAQPSSSVINENGSISIAGQMTDADPQDAHTVVIDWGEGSAATTVLLAAGVAEFSASHLYLDNRPTGTPSDVYSITVSASDDAGAVVTDAMSVTVNNLAPMITSVTGPAAPLPVNSGATMTVNFSDVGTLDTHTVRFAWDDGTADTVLTSGGYSRSASHTFTAAGVYTIAVTVTDDDTGEVRTTYEYIVVYDPSGGFVTGGGWIQSPEGAYLAAPAFSGKATFGFVSKYQKGTTIPTGETEFQLHFATFNFKSTSYQWLVVSGAKAQYKGSGTINGSGDYGFLLTATDGQVNGGGGVDKFRIKIWNKTTGAAVYDNVPGAGDDLDTANPQVIGGGNISIKAK